MNDDQDDDHYHHCDVDHRRQGNLARRCHQYLDIRSSVYERKTFCDKSR